MSFKLSQFILSAVLPLAVSSLITLPTFAGESKTVYVQSQITNLKKDPLSSSSNLGQVNRGDELEVLKQQGIWLQVTTKSKIAGWIPKLFTTKIKPMDQAQLLKDTAHLDSNAKISRRRTTDYAVSAATRGLASTEKHRPGDELYRSNRLAVENLEKLKIDPEKLKTFKSSGNLNEQ